MKDVIATYDAWSAEDQDIGRAVVVRTFGSAPRPEGATLLASADGRIAGSVSGGCVEGATASRIEEARVSGSSRVVRYGISDEQAWDVGLACGGTIDVLVQPFVDAAATDAARTVQGGRTGGRAVITPLPSGSPGSIIGPSAAGPEAPPAETLIVFDDGRLQGSTGTPEQDAALVDASLDALGSGRSRLLSLADEQLFIEAYTVRPRLVIVGAVPVAMALVGLSQALGYQTVVLDGRPAFATEERFPTVDQLLVGWPDELFAQLELGPADAVAVLSHDPKFDEPAIAEALRRGCRYVGAIGSRRTQRSRRARLLERGLSDEEIERLQGPIGLDLGGREPAETALSIMAQVVASRYAASGRSMRDIVVDQ